MALVSRHYKVSQAILATLRADLDLIAAIPSDRWKIQKKAFHRYQAWTPGAFVVPVRRGFPTHESQTLRIVFPVLVAVVWPKDDDLTADLETELALGERVELLFSGNGRTRSSAPLLALDSQFTGADKFLFEFTDIQPGEPFMDGAFSNGFDAIATLINITCSASKRDSSALGA